MKISNIQSARASARLFVTAALVTSIAFAPGLILAADKDAHEDPAEQRIKQLYAKLMGYAGFLEKVWPVIPGPSSLFP